MGSRPSIRLDVYFTGGLEAILTAETGGQNDFRDRKKRFPEAYPVNFGHSLRTPRKNLKGIIGIGHTSMFASMEKPY